MKERKINIEFIRVFAIIMTIVIHVSNIYIYSFSKISNLDYLISVIFNSTARICVPLFFMVSGIFLIKEEFDEKKYFKRIKKFLIILVVWSIIYYLFNGRGVYNNVLEAIINSIFNANKTSRHLWYMYALIGIYIALPFIQNMCKNLNKRQENLFLILWMSLSGGIVIIVPTVKYLFNINVELSYPIPLINATYYLGYFISGYILYNRFKEIKNNKKINFYCIFTFIVSTIITVLFTYIISVINNSVFDSMTWYRSIFIILAAFSIFILVVVNENKIKNKIILKLSNLSFGVYLIHIIFLNIIKWNFDVINYNPIVFIPIITLIVYTLSLFSSFIIKKIPILKNLM